MPRTDPDGKTPFWRHKTLAAMTDAEWESLCDGCGLCCLHKLQDEDDEESYYYTDVACRLLDQQTCRCRDYANRSRKVSDCVRLEPADVPSMAWLPDTCAYRLVAAGIELPAWHHLVCGDRRAVHRAGISRSGRMVCEDDVPEEDWESRIIFRTRG